MIKVSLITPTYNQAKYIEKTIQSVLNQHYPNLEYIIIDGGSTDGTVEIIKKYEKYLTYWISESDRGQSHAVNKGLQYTTGEIINWLNSDDYLEPNSLDYIAEKFTNSKINVLCGYSRLLLTDASLLKRTSDVYADFSKAIGMGHIVQPSTFFRKNIFDELTPLPINLHFMMDHFIWLKYLAKYGAHRIYYSDAIIANIAVHSDAKSIKDISGFHEEKEWIYSSLFKAIEEQNHSSSKNQNNCLQLTVKSESFLPNKRKIYFFLLYDRLFFRNSAGEKIKMRWDILVKLILHFPRNTIVEIINSFLKK